MDEKKVNHKNSSHWPKHCRLNTANTAKTRAPLPCSPERRELISTVAESASTYTNDTIIANGSSQHQTDARSGREGHSPIKNDTTIDDDTRTTICDDCFDNTHNTTTPFPPGYKKKTRNHFYAKQTLTTFLSRFFPFRPVFRYAPSEKLRAIFYLANCIHCHYK